MSKAKSNVGVVILAAGDGKRMKTGVPKVMNVLHGKPLVGHVVTSVEESKVDGKPVVVVCANHTLVQDYLGARAIYVIQEKQLGTGHAVSCAASVLQGKVDDVVVLFGDVPLLKPTTIRQLTEEHVRSNNTITMLTATVPNFDGRFVYFHDLARIKRDSTGRVASIIQVRDATPEELLIKEVDPSGFCFKASWLWKNITRLTAHNAQKELYVTDLIRFALEQGEKLQSLPMDPWEAIGINTKEHLDLAATL